MGVEDIDLASWPSADQFRFFRTYGRPHYAITSRVDVTGLLTRGKARGLSTYRAAIHAIGAGIHAVPELCMRFRGDLVVRHDRVALSMTVPTDDGSFRYAYVPWQADFGAFDPVCAGLIQAAKDGDLNANTGQRDDVAYLSCLPWMDYTALDNALPGPDDCIPRVSWGRWTEGAPGRWQVAMTLQVHHALVDGAQVGAWFAAVQQAFDALA
jgi:chloramphenicol O-acetyltransferase type A